MIPDPDLLAARRRKSAVVTAVALGSFAALMYAISIVKLAL